MRIFLIFGLLLLASSADAVTRYVATNGATTNCTTMQNIATPGSSIAAGLACTQASDTLYIRTGTYAESIGDATVASGTSSNHTIISRYQSEQVILRPTNGSCSGGAINPNINSGRQYITFDGLIVDMSLQANDSGCDTGVMLTQNVVFQNGEVRYAPHSGVFGFVGGTLRNSHIHHNGSDANPAAPDHGIYISGGNPGQNFTIEGNTINNNSSYGLQAYASHNAGLLDNLIVKGNTFYHNGVGNARSGDQAIKRNGGGMIIADGNNIRIYNNICYDEGSNSSYNSCVDIWNDNVTNAVIVNNTFYQASYGINQHDGSVTIRNNIMYSITQGDLVLSGGSRTQDHNLCDSGCTGTGAINGQNPQFLAATSNFNLAGGSPAISAGVDISALVGCTASATCTDFTGTTVRPQGAGWDMGAYEVTGATIVVAITGSNPACTFAKCVVTSSTLFLSGTTTAASAGSVTFATDRGSSGGATWSPGSGWTTNAITLKPGVNNVTITSSDAANNSGSATIAATYAPTFPGNALAGAWGFEAGSGTTAIDSSGNSNTAGLFGASWTTQGHSGNALSFNGSSQYLSVPDANSLDYTQSFTVSAWVKPSAQHNDFRAVAIKNYVIALYASNDGTYCGQGAPVVWFNSNGDLGPSYYACRVTPLPVGVWSHLAATYDGTTLKLYINGALVTGPGTVSASGYMEPTNLPMEIGRSQYGEYFDGVLDEIRVYNFALPLASANNKVYGATCNNEEYTVATASIIGDANCPVIPAVPPPVFKFAAAAAGLKIGAGAVNKWGQSP